MWTPLSKLSSSLWGCQSLSLDEPKVSGGEWEKMLMFVSFHDRVLDPKWGTVRSRLAKFYLYSGTTLVTARQVTFYEFCLSIQLKG